MRIPEHVRLIAGVVGAALVWGSLAAPACALGQIVIFRDPTLGKKYAALEGKLTRLQIQAQADQLSAKMRGKKVVCRGTVEEVFPPDGSDADPEACKVIVALTGVTGFSTPELPVLTYFVPRSRALQLKLNMPVSFSGRLYAIDRSGAVAIELDAPPGWRDPAGEAAKPGGGDKPPVQGGAN